MARNTTINSFNDIKYPYKEKYVTLNDGMKICYIDKGVGIPIIFIHGMGGDLSNFTYNYRYFKEKYRVIGLDLPGYGKSGRLSEDYTIEYYADIVEEFLNKVNIKKCILVGNSMGGHISAVITLREKIKVTRLILVDSAGLTKLVPVLENVINLSLNTSVLKLSPKSLLKQGLKNNFFQPNENKDCRQWMENMTNISENDKEYGDFCHSIKSSMQTMLNSRIDRELGNIDIPVLLVWGKYDCMVPVSYAYSFKEKTKNSKLIIIDEAGHMPMLEKHTTFNKMMDNFIQENKNNFFSNIKELLFN